MKSQENVNGPALGRFKRKRLEAYPFSHEADQFLRTMSGKRSAQPIKTLSKLFKIKLFLFGSKDWLVKVKPTCELW